MNQQASRSLPRCLAVWLGGILAAGLLASLALPTVATPANPRSPTFGDLLVSGAATACLACAAWLAVTTTLVTFEIARGRMPGRVHGCPEPLRRLLVAACGAALLGTLSGPALADDARPQPPARLVRVLDGLELPDRVEDARHRAVPTHSGGLRVAAARPPQPARPTAEVTVSPGDSLWAIAARRLPADAPAATVAAAWRAIYDANRTIIGPDPDLIRPGMLLRLPSLRKD